MGRASQYYYVYELVRGLLKKRNKLKFFPNCDSVEDELNRIESSKIDNKLSEYKTNNLEAYEDALESVKAGKHARNN